MMQPDTILYAATMTATGAGRAGRVTAPDGTLALDLAVPKGLGGQGGPGTNPEQLFAAGYAACFVGAVKLVGRQRKVAIPEGMTVTATVGIGPVGTGYGLTVALDVALPGLERSIAEAIVAGAHERCPYSNATRGNIDVVLRVA